MKSWTEKHVDKHYQGKGKFKYIIKNVQLGDEEETLDLCLEGMNE